MKASLVGEIAVIETHGEKQARVKKFTQELLAKQKNIRTVAVKVTNTEGRFRVRKVKVIAGEKSTETTYRENNCSFRFDLNKVYFSPRLAFERQRISELAQPGEKILVLFAGVGPYAIVIGRKIALLEKAAEKKRQKLAKTEIVGVELNPAGVKYFEQNIALNKVGEIVSAVKGDANKFLTENKNWKKFDRIILPLPKTADKFLEGAVKCCRKGGIVHFYSIQSELADRLYGEAEKKILEACIKQKRRCKFLLERVALPYAPRVVQTVVDFKVI